MKDSDNGKEELFLQLAGQKLSAKIQNALVIIQLILLVAAGLYIIEGKMRGIDTAHAAFAGSIAQIQETADRLARAIERIAERGAAR